MMSTSTTNCKKHTKTSRGFVRFVHFVVPLGGS